LESRKSQELQKTIHQDHRKREVTEETTEQTTCRDLFSCDQES